LAVIKGDDVITYYSQVLPDAATQGQSYLPWVQGSVQEMALPVRIGSQQAATGLLKSVMGRAREFLVIQPEDRKLDVFRMLNWCSPVGNNLAVGWYVVGRQRGFGKLQLRIPILDNLDLFENADLTALYQSIHLFGVMRAIYACIEAVGGDRSKIKDQAGAGFFGLGGSA
jgi:hypothetical protein